MILRNDFHGTEVKIALRSGCTITRSQMRRITKALCPLKSCTCGGIRGPQELDGRRVVIEPISPTEWRVIED